MVGKLLQLPLVTKVTLLLFVSILGCSVKTEQSEDVPVSLNVLEEFRNQDTLSIRASIDSKVDPPPQVAVTLKTLNKAEIVGESLYPIKQQSYPYEFTISASAKDMTDYQLGLFWGEEASEFFNTEEKVKEEVVASTPELKVEEVSTNLKALQCRAGSCEGGIEISGLLRGVGSNITLSVVLLDASMEEVTEPAEVDLGELIVNGEAPFELGIDLPSGVSGHDLTAKVTVVDFTP